MATKKKLSPKGKPAEKRVYFKQGDFPMYSLQHAQRVPAALMNEFGGREGSPPDVAIAMEISPTSSAWPSITGSAVAYGITEGGYNANVISMTPLGRRLVAPEAEGDDVAARREAILRPRLMKEFFEKYDRAKFPGDVIGGNVLKGLGIPQERVAAALSILRENGQYSGIVRATSTGLFVNLDSPGIPAPATTAAAVVAAEVPKLATDTVVVAVAPAINAPTIDTKANKVFITHGKQKEIVAQIKDLLTYGNFDPIVSIERESTAIPVPEKVFEDMRSCAAGVIHVGAEGKYFDAAGAEHIKINDNVLIEIGAAMALYGKKVILLVEKSVALPSNLQGLYRCEFEGDQLNHDATMKLLKTFSQFR